MHHVIIGNGVAGINAALEIRRQDATAEISIISYESDHFFSRTALMYLFCGQLSERCVEPYERDLYKRENFQRVRGRVERLDPVANSLVLESGETIGYDSLLIACGSKPFMLPYPGTDLDGVCNFVTLQDLEEMRRLAARSKKAVVIGGGLIGIEAIEVLSQAGIDCTFLIREDYFWPVALSKAEGDMVSAHMEQHGIKVALGTLAEEIVGSDGKVVGVKTDSGETLAADMVVFAIGVAPNTDFLKDSGVELDERGGIVVNQRLQTSAESIFAAGDCATVEWFNGVKRPEQLWYTGRDQGRIAGANMLCADGSLKEYNRATFYNSAKFFDIEYTTAGFVNFAFDGERDWYQREPDSEISQRVTFLPDGTVIGFNMLGSRWDHRPLVRWVEEKRHIHWVLDHLSEATYDEEFFRKFKVLEPAPGL